MIKIALRSHFLPEEAPPPDDDRLLAASGPRSVRWNFYLVLFMRVLSIGWLIKGLFGWAAIMGLTTSRSIAFDGGGTGYQAVTIYFAVIDLVAGVGLWLASSWGGVLWLLAAMSQLILAVFFPRFVSSTAVLISIFISSIMIYLTLSWLAAVEERD